MQFILFMGILKRIFFTLFILAALIVIFCFLYSKVLEERIIQSVANLSGATYADNRIVTIHFIHGFKPGKDCENQYIRIGGKLGGHVLLEIDNKVVAF